jgi:hypothetical protein
MITDLRTAAALWKVHEIRSDELPGLACTLLEAGNDSGDLRILAGLVQSNIELAPSVFQKILARAGYGDMPLVQAIRIFVRFVTGKIVAGEVGPYEGAREIRAVTMRMRIDNFHGADPFVYAADEYEERPNDRGFFESAIVTEAQRWIRKENF